MKLRSTGVQCDARHALFVAFWMRLFILGGLFEPDKERPLQSTAAQQGVMVLAKGKRLGFFPNENAAFEELYTRVLDSVVQHTPEGYILRNHPFQLECERDKVAAERVQREVVRDFSTLVGLDERALTAAIGLDDEHVRPRG